MGGREMVEEYDGKTGTLLSRQRRTRNIWGKEGEWQVEVGQPVDQKFDPKASTILVAKENPIFMRKDLPECFQWRIRNLPYPKEVYSVTIDEEKQQIVLRTSNKKYFKRIDLPDLKRVDPPLSLEDSRLSWDYKHNTVVISYQRPAAIAKSEAAELEQERESSIEPLPYFQPHYRRWPDFLHAIFSIPFSAFRGYSGSQSETLQPSAQGPHAFLLPTFEVCRGCFQCAARFLN